MSGFTHKVKVSPFMLLVISKNLGTEEEERDLACYNECFIEMNIKFSIPSG